MKPARAKNLFGALALTVADEILGAASSLAPEPGPAAAALVLIGHAPGLSIRSLATGVGLSHAGAVRLVDRLVSEGMAERRLHPSDARACSLHLTAMGETTCAGILEARGGVLSKGMSALNADEIATLGALCERMLRASLRDDDHAYRVCRLCDFDKCTKCPVDAELQERGVCDAASDVG